VLLNLLNNAAKFTEHGAITLEIARSSSAALTGNSVLVPHDSQLHAHHLDWIRFRIADTGIGMTEEQVRQLFTEFTQADISTARKYGGTGLGLALSRHFCRLMGGEITVESQAGQGSSFTVRLPAAVIDPAAPPPETASAPRSPATELVHDHREQPVVS
jgi:signal transduction histidine kinase